MAESKYLFFWGDDPKREGDKSCFSQWSDDGFTYEGLHFPTAEHWMMYQKALHFEDTAIAADVLQARHPAAVKRLGREVRGFTDRKWNGVKYDIVFQGNILKFSQNEGIQGVLLDTGDKILVEASPYDKVWGIGMAEGDPGIEDEANWQGENLLGYALMDVRAALDVKVAPKYR